MSDSLWPHGLQHARLPSPSLSPRICLNSCPLSSWCHPIISFSVTLFSLWFQSSPASESFPMSQLFASSSQSIRGSASASVLPMNIQGWFPFILTGLISLQSMGLSRVFSSTTIWKHQFSNPQPSLWSTPHIHAWLPETMMSLGSGLQLDLLRLTSSRVQLLFLLFVMLNPFTPFIKFPATFL